MKRIEVSAAEPDRFTEEAHYVVAFDEFSLNMYFKPGTSKKALVFSPGFLDRKNYQHPYFQRINWFKEFDATCISIADPTLDLSGDLGLGWMIGKGPVHYLPIVANFLARVLAHNGIAPEDILFFGSSAGGFISLGMASVVKNSTAFAVNPQTNVFAFHHAGELYRTLSACFSGSNMMPIMAAHRHRCELIEFFKMQDYVPRMVYWQNMADKYHYDHHMMPFFKALSDLPPSPSIQLMIENIPSLGHNPPGLQPLKHIFQTELSRKAQ